MSRHATAITNGRRKKTSMGRRSVLYPKPTNKIPAMSHALRENVSTSAKGKMAQEIQARKICQRMAAMRASQSAPPKAKAKNAPATFGCGKPPYARKTLSPATSITDTPARAGSCAAMPNHFEAATVCASNCETASNACGTRASTLQAVNSVRPIRSRRVASANAKRMKICDSHCRAYHVGWRAIAARRQMPPTTAQDKFHSDDSRFGANNQQSKMIIQLAYTA